MKRQANILDYVEKYKYKYGISYATKDGKLVKSLTVLSSIVWVYSIFWTALFILSVALNISNGLVEYSYIAKDFITICSGAVIMVVAAVLLCFKQKFFASIAAFLPQLFMIFSFARFCEDIDGLFGYIAKFYWCHLIPSVLLMLFTALIAVILIRAKIKTDKLYDILLDGLYKQYGKKDGENLTEEQWNEFLSKYNPYKRID